MLFSSPSIPTLRPALYRGGKRRAKLKIKGLHCLCLPEESIPEHSTAPSDGSDTIHPIRCRTDTINNAKRPHPSRNKIPPVSTRKLPYLLRYHRARAGKTALLSDNEKTLLQTILAGLLHGKNRVRRYPHRTPKIPARINKPSLHRQPKVSPRCRHHLSNIIRYEQIHRCSIKREPPDIGWLSTSLCCVGAQGFEPRTLCL